LASISAELLIDIGQLPINYVNIKQKGEALVLFEHFILPPELSECYEINFL